MDSSKYKDEPKVMQFIRERLEMGYNLYGKLDLAIDTRDMLKESVEEAADMSVYLTSWVMQLRMYEKIIAENEFLASIKETE